MNRHSYEGEIVCSQLKVYILLGPAGVTMYKGNIERERYSVGKQNNTNEDGPFVSFIVPRGSD